MQDSERGSTADWERTSSEGSDVAATRRSRRRWSGEEKARIVRESFWPLAWEARGGCGRGSSSRRSRRRARLAGISRT